MAINKRTLLFSGIALVFLITSNTFVEFLTDSWWFESLGQSKVFWDVVYIKMIIFTLVFIVFSGMLILNVQFAFLFAKGQQSQSFDGIKLPSDNILKILAILASLIIAFIGASTATSNWDLILKYINRSEFAHSDPIFSLNVGFYIFQLPFYKALRGWLLVALVLGIIFSAVIYFIKGITQFIKDWENPYMSKVRYHLSALLMLLVLMFSLGFWFDRYELLYSTSGVTFGAGYTDVHARILSNTVMTLISLISAFMILLSIFWRKGIKVLLTAISIFIICHIVFKIIYPSFQQKFIVEPNELEKEKPYIHHNIKLTRQAYKLSDVERHPFELKGALTKQDIKNNKTTIENIRLWDWRPLLSTYRQIQEIRLYYKFGDVDVDRYKINQKEQQVMIAARELSYEQVPEEAKTWVNQRLKYTHGYGIVMSPVNKITENGLPEFFIRDIPPISNIDIKVDRPAIYYGEETNHYIFTGTTTKEFDYPLGNKNQVTKYKGKGGVPISSLWRRIIYALRFKDLKLLISEYMTNQVKVHYHRNILARVQKIAPFLSYDHDPYIIVVNGKLHWIIDAYTLDNQYPYSQPIENTRVNFNYIRNSVKIVIDAYGGDIKFVITDNDDPLIKTYQKMFPSIFTNIEKISPEIVEHFRYPQDLFHIQAQIYSSYHMSDPEVFYNREDKWKMPTEIYDSTEQMMDPYYVTLRLPQQKRQKFMLILPFTPINKNNMISWMSAHWDQKNHGDLTLYEFPKNKLVYGPMQIEARIDQDPVISELLTLWNQKGSSVIRGNLLTIPIEESLLYVEPIYLQAEQGQMPELKRVIVSHDNRILIAETLEQAISGLFGYASLTSDTFDKSSTNQTEQINSMIKETVRLYNQAQKALQKGNWASYGENQKQLGEILKSLKKNSKNKL